MLIRRFELLRSSNCALAWQNGGPCVGVNEILRRIPSKKFIRQNKICNLDTIHGGLARFGWNSPNITERGEASFCLDFL
jgi:hypothetical protein